MGEAYTETKITQSEDLYRQYNWFYQSFLPAIQTSCDEFFSELFTFKFISLSKNINILFQGSDYFVTKIRIDKQHDVFFRCSEDAVKIILDKVLGAEKNKKFDISKTTELEAKIISSFNDNLYNSIAHILLPPEQNKKRKNFDTVHLTFFIKDNDGEQSGKFILSLPENLLAPSLIESFEQKFDVSDFKSSTIDVNIKIGTTKFPVKDLKLLEKEDIVIFEESNIQLMKLSYQGFEKTFRITPNPGLIISIDNNDGGNNMEETALSQSLWDNIQVEMGAEFDKVKISLGELKNIEQGVVVDISSVYNNKISLIVEDKTIAKGELVIINDRYGVRIDEVFVSSPNRDARLMQDNEESSEEHFQEHSNNPEGEFATEESNEEEFDYSDFELDDQDI